jgi:hypothetical protein
MPYTRRERLFLALLAICGFAGLNGVFVWAVASRPEALTSALRNPVAAAFMAEALVLVGVLAYLLARWRLIRMHWGWFVLLSLVGGIAFALPVALLWRSGQARPVA